MVPAIRLAKRSQIARNEYRQMRRRRRIPSPTSGGYPPAGPRGVPRQPSKPFWEEYLMTAAVQPGADGAVGVLVNMTGPDTGLLVRWTPAGDQRLAWGRSAALPDDGWENHRVAESAGRLHSRAMVSKSASPPASGMACRWPSITRCAFPFVAYRHSPRGHRPLHRKQNRRGVRQHHRLWKAAEYRPARRTESAAGERAFPAGSRYAGVGENAKRMGRSGPAPLIRWMNRTSMSGDQWITAAVSPFARCIAANWC